MIIHRTAATSAPNMTRFAQVTRRLNERCAFAVVSLSHHSRKYRTPDPIVR